ncbi:32233_t:CDS:1, partial [Gigaspora margarita]
LMGSIYIDDPFLIDDNIDNSHIETESSHENFHINEVDDPETNESLQT